MAFPFTVPGVDQNAMTALRAQQIPARISSSENRMPVCRICRPLVRVESMAYRTLTLEPQFDIEV